MLLQMAGRPPVNKLLPERSTAAKFLRVLNSSGKIPCSPPIGAVTSGLTKCMETSFFSADQERGIVPATSVVSRYRFVSLVRTDQTSETRHRVKRQARNRNERKSEGDPRTRSSSIDGWIQGWVPLTRQRSRPAAADEFIALAGMVELEVRQIGEVGEAGGQRHEVVRAVGEPAIRRVHGHADHGCICSVAGDALPGRAWVGRQVPVEAQTRWRVPEVEGRPQGLNLALRKRCRDACEAECGEQGHEQHQLKADARCVALHSTFSSTRSRHRADSDFVA